MIPLHDKLFSAIVTVFSKLLSTFADNRVTNYMPWPVCYDLIRVKPCYITVLNTTCSCLPHYVLHSPCNNSLSWVKQSRVSNTRTPQIICLISACAMCNQHNCLIIVIHFRILLSVKQLLARFLNHWGATSPCYYMSDIHHYSCFWVLSGVAGMSRGSFPQ